MENLKFSSLQPLPFLLHRTHQNLAPTFAFGAELELAHSGGWKITPKRRQERSLVATQLLGAGTWSWLAAVIRYSLWRSCFGESVSWKRRTFAVCNSVWKLSHMPCVTLKV